ncbi:hypothetical protein A4G20_02920 [Pasteurellaceae bacterium RH1A]|nr:hypothetical protein A4G20_02920 [Pasteurellaceae bacterium RH1A]
MDICKNLQKFDRLSPLVFWAFVGAGPVPARKTFVNMGGHRTRPYHNCEENEINFVSLIE